LEVQKIKRIQLKTLKQKQKEMKNESMRIEDVIKKAKVLSRAPSHQHLAKAVPQME
jgi:RNA-binding protein YlmH